jgi:hypothetical protein
MSLAEKVKTNIDKFHAIEAQNRQGFVDTPWVLVPHEMVSNAVNVFVWFL